MAYELQMQYLQENQNAGAGGNQQYNNNPYPVSNYSNGGGSYGSHNVAGSYDGIQGFHPVDAPHTDPVKKKGFYKKLKRNFDGLVNELFIFENSCCKEYADKKRKRRKERTYKKRKRINY